MYLLSIYYMQWKICSDAVEVEYVILSSNIWWELVIELGFENQVDLKCQMMKGKMLYNHWHTFSCLSLHPSIYCSSVNLSIYLYVHPSILRPSIGSKLDCMDLELQIKFSGYFWKVLAYSDKWVSISASPTQCVVCPNVNYHQFLSGGRYVSVTWILTWNCFLYGKKWEPPEIETMALKVILTHNCGEIDTFLVKASLKHYFFGKMKSQVMMLKGSFRKIY